MLKKIPTEFFSPMNNDIDIYLARNVYYIENPYILCGVQELICCEKIVADKRSFHRRDTW